jgi:hypothetical protein
MRSSMAKAQEIEEIIALRKKCYLWSQKTFPLILLPESLELFHIGFDHYPPQITFAKQVEITDDIVEDIDTPRDFIVYNLVYWNNNPVYMLDIEGKSVEDLLNLTLAY